MANDLDKLEDSPQRTEGLLKSLRELIQGARQKVLRAVDTVQVQTCWQIGRHIVEFEQGGAARADYGMRLLPILAESLTREIRRGSTSQDSRFRRNLRIRVPLRPRIIWTD